MKIRATRKGIFAFSATKGWREFKASFLAREMSDAPPDGAAFAGAPKKNREPGSARSGSKVGNDCPELSLPDALRSLVTPENKQHATLPSTLIAAALGILSVAVGNGAVIEDKRLFSTAVNASLGFIIIDDTDGCAQVLSSCSQVLAEIQDARLDKLTEEGIRGIEKRIQDIQLERESYFGKDKYRNPRIEANYAAQVQSLRRVLRPLLKARNPGVGRLRQAALTSGGAGLLVTYSRNEAVCHLLEGNPRSCCDLELLNGAWNNETPDPLSMNSRQLPIVRPVVTVFLLCSDSTATRIVGSEEPLVRELAERMIFVNAARVTPSSNTGLTPVWLPKAFRETVSRLVAARDSNPQGLLKLSRRAAAALLDYARETERYRQERGRWFGEPVILAAKIALICHLCSAQQANLIHVHTMRQAITLARQLRELSVKVVQDLKSTSCSASRRRD